MTVHPLPPPTPKPEPPSWREFVTDFVEVGRCLERIEDRLRTIVATRSCNDLSAAYAVAEIRRCARRLDRVLESLDFRLRDLKS